jgi:hypothetical protein
MSRSALQLLDTEAMLAVTSLSWRRHCFPSSLCVRDLCSLDLEFCSVVHGGWWGSGYRGLIVGEFMV